MSCRISLFRVVKPNFGSQTAAEQKFDGAQLWAAQWGLEQGRAEVAQ